MEAQPRPLRVLKVSDENQPLPLQATKDSKTIHQRNKSTPALSSLMQFGGLKVAAKRAAFADVSNIRTTSTRDDLAVGKKNDLKEKITAVVDEISKPTTNLQRPAQRPLSSLARKPLASQPANAPTIHEASEALVPTQPMPRKVLSKRATTIFRETTESVPVHHPAPARPEPVKETSEPSVPEEAAPEVQSRNAEIERKEAYIEALEEQARLLEQKSQELLQHAQAQSEVVEPQEYWDEEDEQEFYDAEGYTTARSLKSRSENTTGGITLPVVAPPATSSTQDELKAARIHVENNRTPDEVEDELWDTSMVAEYGEEIFEYMSELEEKMRPNPYYMDSQTEIQWSMRSVLIDWVVQVHHRFNLLPETLFLCINYIDRFLSVKVVSLGKLQLVGATALFVAAKYEEINCPSVQEMVYMVDGGYTVDEILKAERFMLTMLQFELGWPGPMSFLRRISKADDYDLETRTLAKYFLEITIMDERFVSAKPSFLAAGAHCLARFMLKKGDWSLSHVHYSGYTLGQLKNVINVLLECCENPTKHHQAIYNKYTDKRYKSASLFVEMELQKGFVLPLPMKKVERCSLSSDLAQSWKMPNRKVSIQA